MKPEDKKLLLKDLCSRLPYGVKINEDIQGDFTLVGLTKERVFTTCEVEGCHNDFPIELIKPYLFPLSSMTEEQKREYNRRKYDVPVCHYEYGDVVEEIELYDSPYSYEYLIENHFDIFDLIPKGLAKDATGLGIY